MVVGLLFLVLACRCRYIHALFSLLLLVSGVVCVEVKIVYVYIYIYIYAMFVLVVWLWVPVQCVYTGFCCFCCSGLAFAHM